jgi:tRNA-modifying protein YgfZ
MTTHASQPKQFALSQFSLIQVDGSDAASLLQGQLSCDVRLLSEHQANMAALCNPKGQVLGNFLICRLEEGFLLCVPAPMASAVAQRLQRYVLRAKVGIHYPVEQWHCYGLLATSEQTQTLPTQAYAIHEQRNIYFLKWPDDAPRYLCLSRTSGAPESLDGDDAAWHAWDVEAKLPWIVNETSERFTPQMLNLDQLGAISFNKGCYTGQEIIARTHYLGKAKRSLYLGTCAAATDITPGQNILMAETGQTVGQVLTFGSVSDGIRVLMVLSKLDTLPVQLALDDTYKTRLTVYSND